MGCRLRHGRREALLFMGSVRVVENISNAERRPRGALTGD